MRWRRNQRARRKGKRTRKRGAARLALASTIGAVLAGGALLGVASSPAADGPTAGDRDLSTMIEATHLAPLLTAPGEAVTLRYDIYCPPPGPDPESGAPCDAEGTVYVRPGDTGTFRSLPLELDSSAAEGRYRAAVPPGIATSPDGFSYYAVLRSRTTGATKVLPPSGATGPERSRPIGSAIRVSLGGHAFGATRRPTARAASARWGSGPADAGLEPGPQSQPVGGSSFAVDASRSVSLLDEANRRVLRFGRNGGPPTVVPVAVRGTMADLGVGTDGGLSVLETVADAGAMPLLRRFDANGRSLGTSEVADPSVSALRVGPEGPAVLGYPDGRWLPVTDHGSALSQAEQRRRGRVGRLLPGGDELVVEREGNEARIAEVGPDTGSAAGVRRSWQITSDTPLGEIQLAEPFRSGVLVVLRVYTDSADEFEVLALGANGVAQRFSAPSRAWAETAPLARFRLAGSSLYELGSTPDGVFVDRYDLEVTS